MMMKHLDYFGPRRRQMLTILVLLFLVLYGIVKTSNNIPQFIQEVPTSFTTTITSTSSVGIMEDSDKRYDKDAILHDINSSSGSTFQNEKIRTWINTTHSYDKNHGHTFQIPESMANHCKRWGVVTTIFNPNEAITRVADMPSWCLVIVPDTKTPVDYMDKLERLLLQNDNGVRKSTTLEKIFFFSIEKHKEWEKMEGPFGMFARLIPWKHFSRKNIGYLFAILHGAQYIFDFDDDNFIKLDKDGKPLQILPNGNDPTGIILEDVNIIMQGGNVFNHHPIMGASLDDSWA